jgi:prolyl-tRNA synthetase
MSRLLVKTLRDAPADAEAASHRLLVRAGYIRRLASGVYTFLPLGLRVVQNVARIAREELAALGAQELLLPVLHPRELYEMSGRDESMDDVLMRVHGKGGHFNLGPTNEEIATVAVASEVESHRDLPVIVFQIQTKFRDEARPRFGLLRGREFVMNDAYSFDADQPGMRASYQAMHEAYGRIFRRCGLDAVPVDAHSGAMGGDVNHEFMVPSAIGEDHFARCPACGYAANVEAATAGERADTAPGASGHEPREEPLVEHHTPDCPGIAAVVEHFAGRGLTAAGMLKCIALLDGEDRPVVALVPGDRDVRVPPGMRPFAPADFDSHPALVRGYIGPMGLESLGVLVIADPAVRHGGPWVTGANRPDYHVTGATLGRDFDVDEWASLATVAAGDGCPRCGAVLDLVRSVEAGHTFQLGLTYSSKMPGATFLDERGREQPLWMGCYGIGISRAVAVIAEEHHDDAGLAWPDEVAPFAVHLLALGSARSPEVADAADRLYGVLGGAGTSVLYDDRDASPGVKFADADLLGMPVQLVIGAKGLARGMVERKARKTGERDDVALGDLLGGAPAAAAV